MKMEKEECWATFMTSGKVTDYLNYRQATEWDVTDTHTENHASVFNERQGSSDDRVNHNAGFY